jgi:ribosomal protein L22
MISSEMPEDLTNDLKNIENKSHIKLFKKYNNIFILRDVEKIINECNRMKKKIIIDFSNDLKNLCSNNIDLYT